MTAKGLVRDGDMEEKDRLGVIVAVLAADTTDEDKLVELAVAHFAETFRHGP